jgi:hypothetical protein
VEFGLEVEKQLEGAGDVVVDGAEFGVGLAPGGEEEVVGGAEEEGVVGAQVVVDLREGGGFELPI